MVMETVAEIMVTTIHFLPAVIFKENNTHIPNLHIQFGILMHPLSQQTFI